MASRASLGKSFNLLGMCLRRPFIRPLLELQVGTGQLLLPFFLWAFMKQELHTRVSEPTSESDKLNSEAKAFVVTGLEFSTITLQMPHWWGALLTVREMENVETNKEETL